MPRRTIRDEADARRCLRSLDESGLSLVEWAREHAVDGRSLRFWGLRLERRMAPMTATTPMRLVELIPDDRGAVASAGPRYVVRVGGGEVEVGDDFRQETLARLLAVLAC